MQPRSRWTSTASDNRVRPVSSVKSMHMGGSMAGTQVFLTATIISALFFGLTIPSQAQETSHLQFVTEYIRELGKIERIRSQANDELNDGSDRMAGCVRSATRFQLELQTQISMLQNMRLNPPFDELAPRSPSR
jgi:hypothetical protein